MPRNYSKGWYERHREEHKARMREAYYKNQAKRQEYQRAYYHAHREERGHKAKIYARINNPEVKLWCKKCGERRVGRYHRIQLCSSCYRIILNEDVKCSTEVVRGVEVAKEYVPPTAIAARSIGTMPVEQIIRNWDKIVTSNRRTA